jgi:hypothetical protein
MKYLILLSIFISSIFSSQIDLGKWNKESFNTFLKKEKSIDEISASFLNTPYKANVLIGSYNKNEELVIDLANLDCFTYIDYVEAIKNSNDFDSFKKNLISIRYKNSTISFENRNHFFTDWISQSGFKNITSKLSQNSKKTTKYLNKKDEDSLYLNGIDIVKREIKYLEPKYITKDILTKLQTGDYIGIYTPINGLDVTHTGMIIKKDGKTFFRHASSKKSNRKVVDELFVDYVKKTPGILVLRK